MDTPLFEKVDSQHDSVELRDLCSERQIHVFHYVVLNKQLKFSSVFDLFDCAVYCRDFIFHCQCCIMMLEYSINHRYIHYVKQRFKPVLTKEAESVISGYYQLQRRDGTHNAG